MNFDTRKVIKLGRSPDATDTSSSSYLQLRKDNLRIPAEFYEFNIQDDTMTQSERLQIPKLKLPVDPVAAKKDLLVMENIFKQPVPTPSEHSLDSSVNDSKVNAVLSEPDVKSVG